MAAGKKKSDKAADKAKPTAKTEDAKPEEKAEPAIQAPTETKAKKIPRPIVRKTPAEKKAYKKAKVKALKEKKKLVEKKPPPTDAEKEVARKRAIMAIKSGLALEWKKQQKTGFPFVPADWGSEYKHFLGSYFNFVKSCNEFKIIPGESLGKYTIHMRTPGEVMVAKTQKTGWQLQLHKTLQAYYAEVPKDDRKPEEFMDMVKELFGASAKTAAQDAGKESAPIPEDSTGAAGAEKRSAVPEGGAKKKRKSVG